MARVRRKQAAIPGDGRNGWVSAGAAMLLHARVTVYPLTIAAGRVRYELNCDRA